MVAADAELLDIYLAGTPPDRLIEEISCGKLGISGVKVIVPADRYDIVVERFGQLNVDADLENWSSRSKFLWFLSGRCDRSFLKQYLDKNPSFVDQLTVMSYLNALADIDVIACLHSYGLLPEEKRRLVVATLSDLAVNTPDPGFLRSNRRDLFTDEELERTLRRVRDELIPKLEQRIDEWKDSYSWDPDAEPGGYFEPLADALQVYREELLQEEGCREQIDSALNAIEVVIDELRSDYRSRDDEEFYDSTDRPPPRSEERSIFEDVDA